MVLNLDADEWLSDALRHELLLLLSATTPLARSYLFKVRLVFPTAIALRRLPITNLASVCMIAELRALRHP